MSSQIQPVLVVDDALLISDSIGYAVAKSGKNISTQKYIATSASANSHVYSVVVPSTSVVVDRSILWHCKTTLTITGTPAAGEQLVTYGVLDALAPMPLHQAVNNMQCQINNASVSVTTNQILDPLLRAMGRNDLSAINNTAPCYLDNVGSYSQLNLAGKALGPNNNNPLGGYNNAIDPDYQPRGSYVVGIAGNAVGDGATSQIVTIVFESTENIVLSPFLYGDVEPFSQPGLHGITNMNFTMSMDATAARMFRWYDKTVGGNKKITNVSYDQNECYLECRFYTPPASVMLPAIGVTPYQQFINYTTQSTTAVPTATKGDIVTSNIQLSSIPDKMFLFVRDAFGNLKNNRADSYGTITNVSVNFSNQTGLLSGTTAQDLWKFSKQSGSNQSWLEFSGVANVAPIPIYNVVATVTENLVQYGLLPVVTGTAPKYGQGINQFATTGSVLMLDFSSVIALEEEYYSCGSQGQFNLNVTINYTNNTGDEFINPTANLLVMNSGIFVNSMTGQASLYTGILDKARVLDVSTSEPVSKQHLARIVGSGFFSKLKAVGKTALKHAAPHLANAARSLVKEHLGEDHPLGHLANMAIGATGYGMSAGGQSGGRLRKYLK
jgi:hypothetical protein